MKKRNKTKLYENLFLTNHRDHRVALASVKCFCKVRFFVFQDAQKNAFNISKELKFFFNLLLIKIIHPLTKQNIKDPDNCGLGLFDAECLNLFFKIYFSKIIIYSFWFQKKTQVSGFEHPLIDHTPSTLTLDYGVLFDIS